MLWPILVFSFIVLVLIAKIIWDRLDLNVEVWRFRDDTQYVWIFEQFQHRIEFYTGTVKHTAAHVEILKWRSKALKDNIILVYDDDKELRPRWRGRWLYHVKSGSLVPLPYTLTFEAGKRELSAETVRSWLQANFGEEFANAITESPFGWREILIIAVLLFSLISAYFGYSTNKAQKVQTDILHGIEQRLPATPTPPISGERD